MRWKHKLKKYVKPPEHWDTRETIVFLWWPTIIRGSIRWLERVWVRERYRGPRGNTPFCNNARKGYWFITEYGNKPQ